MVEVEFRRLRSVAEFVEGDALPAQEARVRLVADDGGPVAADVLGRRLFYLLESVENARALLNQVAGTDGAFHDRAYPARISYVQMDSPSEIVLVVPLGVLSLVALVWGGLKQLPVAYKTVKDGQLSEAQARSANADAESKELDNVVKKTQVKRYLERLATEIGADADADHADQHQLDQTLVQLEESLEQLNAQDVTELELPAAVDPDRSPEPVDEEAQSPKP